MNTASRPRTSRTKETPKAHIISTTLPQNDGLLRDYNELAAKYAALQSLYNEIVSDDLKAPLPLIQKRQYVIKAQNIQLQRELEWMRSEKAENEELVYSVHDPLESMKESLLSIAQVNQSSY